MERPVRAAVGLDGVLYDIVGAILDRLRYCHNIILDRDSVNTSDISKIVQDEAATKDLIRLVNPFTKDDEVACGEFFNTVKPFPWAWDTLERLNSLGLVLAITKRPPRARPATRMALRRDFGDMIKDISFSSRPWDFCVSQQITHVFDKAKCRVPEYLKRGIIVYLIGQDIGMAPSIYLRMAPDFRTAVRDLKKRRSSGAIYA